MSSRFVFGVLTFMSFLYLAVCIPLAGRFPPVNADEVVRADMGMQIVHGRTARYTLFDDIFARPVYAMRDVLPETSIALYHTWIGVWTWMHPMSAMSARSSSLVAGFLALMMFYLIGARLGGPSMGLWCTLLVGTSPFFLAASCIARPETLLLLTSSTVLWLTLRIPNTMGLKPFLIGSLSTLQLSVHPNAAVIGAGLFFFYLSDVRKDDRFAKGFLFVVGGGVGILLALIMVDLPRLWMGFHTLHSFLLRPPFLIWPWHPIFWIIGTCHILWSGETYNFSIHLDNGWSQSLHLWWGLMAVLVAITVTRARTTTLPFDYGRWGIAGLIALFTMILLVKAKESLYGTNFLPFLIPMAAAALSKSQKTKSPRMVSAIAMILIATSLFHFFNFCRFYEKQTKSLSEIETELRVIPALDSLRIVGPSVLWFGLNKDHFRDAGAIIFSHWYSNGEVNLKEWLGIWRPDILILDPEAQSVIRRSAHASLAANIGCPVELLGIIDTEKAYGLWQVYRIHWPSRPLDREAYKAV